MAECLKCSSPLDAGGNCPVCLLQLGLQESIPRASLALASQSIPSPQELASCFPQLEIVRSVGRGGMGAIYLARQSSLGRNVALKLLTTEASTDNAFIERFEREARALAMLSHPNIVTVFDFGRTKDGLAYLIMEYIDGANLRQAIAARRMSPAEAVELMLAIGKAIEYAHSKGVVHRDLKPENILLGEDGSVKVADFGIAKIVNDPKQHLTLTATRQVLGSPHYLAPEQLEAPDQVDHRIDLYALGVIFYELLTGQLPLGLFEAPSHLIRDVDTRLDSIVLKLLHRNPAQRYQTVAELLADLRNDTSSDVGFPASRRQPASRPASVPFTAESHGGLAEAQGILQVTAEGLLFEYIVVDAIFGGIKSELKQVELPRDKIIKVSLSPGVFSSRLCILTNAMSAISQLPACESGQIKLVVKKADIELAEDVVHSMGFGDTHERTGKRKSLADQYFPTPALLMMLCAILNGGFLAIFITGLMTTNQLKHPEMALIAISVVYGLLITVQLVGSFIHLVSGMQSPWRVALIAAAIPITPVFLVSFPIAIWWWIRNQYNANSRLSKFSESGRPSWTATTMIYLRENRTARVLSLLNLLGIAVLSTGLAIYFTGWIPATTRYRVLSESDADMTQSDADSLRTRIAARLEGIVGSNVSINRETNRVEVGCWNRYQSLVTQRLEIPQAPTLVLIMGLNSGGETISGPSKRLKTLDVASGIDIPGSELIGAGRKVRCSTQDFLLDQSQVKAIFHEFDPNGGPPSLRCVWSSTGRTRFDRFVSDSIDEEQVASAWYVGLVVNGVIQAKAALKESSNQFLEFSLSDELAFGSESLMAAVRGPNLDLELELLK